LGGHTNFPDSTYVSEHILPLPISAEMSHELIAKIASVVNGEKTLH
jgi:dTDP-4-amino-4,6-dideoxygalactose transaminase